MAALYLTFMWAAWDGTVTACRSSWRFKGSYRKLSCAGIKAGQFTKATSPSPVESLYALEVPPRTPMYVGRTSNQGGIYVSGRTRVFIPEPWNFKVISETPLP